MRYFIYIHMLLLLGTSLLASSPLPEVVYANSASDLEILAAKEIRRYIYLRTDEHLPLSRVDSLPATGDLIVVGNQNSDLMQGLTIGHTSQPGGFVLKTLQLNERNILVVSGNGSEATLSAAYRYAEKVESEGGLGIFFGLAEDVIPDSKISNFSLADLDEAAEPLFQTRGLNPWHDFPSGPDLWSTDDYRAIIGQLPKLGMNFIGLHSYTKYNEYYHFENKTFKRGPEPNVWIGLPGDYDEQGQVSWSYPAYYSHSRRPNLIWGQDVYDTGEYHGGAKELFPADGWGADVYGETPPADGDMTASNAVFNKVGEMFNQAFTHAAKLGVKTALGTELPLGLEVSEDGETWSRTIPEELQPRLTTEGRNSGDTAIKEVYKAIFDRIQKTHPLDYFWLWSWEVWPGKSEASRKAFKDDIALAKQALAELGNPFTLGFAGWKLGAANEEPGNDADDEPAIFDGDFDLSSPFYSLLGSAIGYEKLSEDRVKWPSTFLEYDAYLGMPELALNRIHEDAKAALAIQADGLIAKHWRTRILSSNVGAMKELMWAYGPTGTDKANWTKAADRDAGEFITDYYRRWAKKMFGSTAPHQAIGDFFTDLEAAFVGSEIPKPLGWTDDERDDITGRPSLFGGGTSPCMILPNPNTWESEKSRYAFVDTFGAWREQINGAGHLERFDYWLNAFQAWKKKGEYGCVLNDFDSAMASVRSSTEVNRLSAATSALEHRKTLARLFEEIMGYETQKAFNSSDLGDIMNLEVINWKQLMINKHDSDLKTGLGMSVLPAEANPSQLYSSTRTPYIRVAAKRTQVDSSESLTLKILAPGVDSTPQLKYRTIGATEWTSQTVTPVDRAVYQATIPAQNDDFEYFLESGSTRFPVNAPLQPQTIITLGEPVPQTGITRVISFGDSLSDMGNIEDAPISNGPVWIDQLSRNHLELDSSVASSKGGLNYAYAGASTGDVSDELDPPSAAQQIELFAQAGGSFAADDLVTLWIGGNDFLNDPENPTPPATLSGRYDAILRRLIALGARNIMWGLLPDPGQLHPYIGSNNRATYSAYAISVNDNIRALENTIESAYPDVAITLFDYHSLQAQIIQDPAAYGVSDPRIAIPDGTDLSTAFLMPDGVHPTTKGHQIIAAAAYDTLLAEWNSESPQNASASSPTQTLLTRGILQIGQTLVVDSSLLSNTNATTSFSYQWQRDGADISGETGQSFILIPYDAGTAISAVVSYTNLDGTQQTVSTSWDGVVQTAESAHTFYVSPNGSDSNDGSLSAPWQTLNGARINVRPHLDGYGHIVVNLMTGHYQLSSTVVYSLLDSGSANQTISYQAMQGHSPTFSSLQELTGWTVDPNNSDISIASLPQGISHPRFLYDSRSDWMERSATAKFTTEEPAAAPGQVENTTDHLERQDERSNFQYPASFPFPDPSSIAQYDLRQSIIGWHMEILPLTTIDTNTRRVTTAIPSCYEIREDTTEDNPAGLWILNTYEGLDTVGEWASLSDSIYLYGRDPRSRIFVPTLTELVRVDDGTNGKDDAVTPVSHLRFKGLTFSGGDFYVMQDTKGDTLADRQKEITIQHDWAVVDKPTGLLRLRNTAQITVEDCRFIKSGGTGLRVDRFGQHIAITGNEFRHLGRCGVSLIGRGPGYGNVNHSNIIANNTFRRTGMEKWAAPALVIDQSTSNLVKHNAWSDTYFTAITVTGPRQAGILSKAEKLDAATDVAATAIDYDGREFHYYGLSPSFEAFLDRTSQDDQDLVLASLHAMQFVYNYDNYIEENLFKDVGDGAGLFFNGKSVYISGGTRDMDESVVRKNYFRYNYIYDSKPQSFADYAWYNDYDQDGAEMVGNMMNNLTAPSMPLILATSGYAEGGNGRAPVLIQSNLDLQSTYGAWVVDGYEKEVDGNNAEVVGIQLQGNLQNGQGGDVAYVGDYERMLAFLQRGSVASVVLPETTNMMQTLTSKVTEFSGSIPPKQSPSPPSLMIGATTDPVDASQLQVLLQAAGDGHYQLQRSTDLQTWTTVRAVEISEGVADIYQSEIDPKAFYRIKTL